MKYINLTVLFLKCVHLDDSEQLLSGLTVMPQSSNNDTVMSESEYQGQVPVQKVRIMLFFSHRC